MPHQRSTIATLWTPTRLASSTKRVRISIQLVDRLTNALIPPVLLFFVTSTSGFVKLLSSSGKKIAELQTGFQELLKQQLATHSARVQQTCFLGTLWPGDELADPEFLISISSGDLNVLPAVALNFENLVAKVLPITISSAAMVKEKGRLIGIGIFELDEHFSTLDNPAALCALLYFRHCFLTYRGLEQASRDRRIVVLR